jgi:hypothetical protein
MHFPKSAAVAASLAGILSAVVLFAPQASNAVPLVATLKPISGKGDVPGAKHLMSFEIGRKHAVSYFQSEAGHCKLTLMVAEAFDGDDVPNETTVRFEVGIDPARTALFDTAEGKGLEFTCADNAQAMTVRTVDQVASYAPAM